MVNLHYSYVQQLATTAREEIDSLRHRDAISHISKAFRPLTVLLESEKIRGEISLDTLEVQREALVDLVNQLPPNIH